MYFSFGIQVNQLKRFMILAVNSNDSGGGNFHNTMVCHDHPSWKIFWLRTFCQRYVRENNYGDHITENKHSLGDCDKSQDNFLNFHLLVFFVPLEIFLLILRPHHYRWGAANVDLCSALKAIEQWGFFSVPRLLWHGASVYNGHHRGSATLIPTTERLASKLTLLIYTN